MRFAHDRKAGAIKNLLGRTRRKIHLVKKGRDQETARSVVVIDNLARRHRGQDQRVFTCLDGRKAMRVTPETPLVRIAARGVNDGETDVRAGVLQLGKQSIDAYTLASNIVFAPDLRVHRDRVAFSAGLHAEACEVNLTVESGRTFALRRAIARAMSSPVAS